ncbi:MAG: NAD(P)H-dependent oxidoreductase [Chitinophagales bacterium]|nr:NAD(P)H-dependent oxidoreductase [Chitinophagales bacterium]
MKKYRILAMGASSSKSSINKQLAAFAASLVKDAEIDLIDLNDFEMQIYSIDRERENGIPDKALQFRKHINDSDGIIISLAEHNGAYTAAFKNIMDWASRIGKDLWDHKPMLLMATAPGLRGGQTILEIAAAKFVFMGGNIIGTFSLPKFHENFSDEFGIQIPELDEELRLKITEFDSALKSIESKAHV